MNRDDVLELAGGFCEAALLQEAVAWGLFDLTRTAESAASLARRLRLLRDKLDPVLAALTALGFLRRTRRGFVNAPLAARHLVTGAADDLRAYVLHLRHQWKLWRRLPEVLVRRGALPQQQDRAVHRDPARHRRFLAAMAQESAGSLSDVSKLPDWSNCSRFLDLGGGHGRHAVAIARRHPALRGEVWDVPASGPVVRAAIAKAGLEARLAFQDLDVVRGASWPRERFDVVVVRHVLANFPAPTIRRILARAAARLTPGGRLLVISPWLDAGRATPAGNALFAVHMMVGCEHGWVPPVPVLAAALRGCGLCVTIERHGPDEVLLRGRRVR